jgi:hypothetical protein
VWTSEAMVGQGKNTFRGGGMYGSGAFSGFTEDQTQCRLYKQRDIS